MSSVSSRQATTATAPGWVRYCRVITSPDGVVSSSSTNAEIRPSPSTVRERTGQVIGSKPVLIDDPQKKPEEQAGFKIMDDSGNPNEAGRAKLVAFIKNSTMYLSDKRVFVKADADLPFKYVNELFQLCREGGADEASVVTSEDKSGEKKK